MKRTLLLAFSLAAAAASAQNLPLWWTGSTATNDPSDTTVATAIDATNSTYQLAKVTAPGNQDIRLTKFNSLGQAVWTRLYDFGTVDVANAMQLDADGDPVFVGSRFDAGTSTTQMLLAKADKTTGDLLWNRSYAPQAGGTSRIAFDFKILPDATIIVAGTNNDAGGEHPSVVKFNESAAFALFTKNYSFVGRSTHIDYSGTHLFAGTELITPAHYLAVIQMPIADGVGDIVRPTFNGGDNYYQFTDIAALNSSSCALTGYLSSDLAGTLPIRSLYGAINVVTGSHTFRNNPAETFFLTRDVEYDMAAGTVAYQAYVNAGGTYVLMGAYNPVTGLSDVSTSYSVVGAAAGLQSLGNNRFAALTNNGANLAVNLVDFTLGWQSSTAVGPATVPIGPSGIPLAVHSNLSAAGRAVVVGGSSAANPR
ncbi:hypothetical protein EON81_08225 [bacterium]|nr:MAG: hypothetical protein EON81_08225 [bacterium]